MSTHLPGHPIPAPGLDRKTRNGPPWLRRVALWTTLVLTLCLGGIAGTAALQGESGSGLLPHLLIAGGATWLAVVGALAASRQPTGLVRLILTALAALSAAASGLLLPLLVAAWRLPYSPFEGNPTGYTWSTLAAPICAYALFALVAVVCHLRLMAGLVLAALLFCLAATPGIVAGPLDELMHDRYLARWRAAGWATEFRQAFPEPTTRKECAPWLDAISPWNDPDATSRARRELDALAGAFTRGELLQDGLAAAPDLPDELAGSAFDRAAAEASRLAAACPVLRYLTGDELAASARQERVAGPASGKVFLWSRAALVRSLTLAAAGCDRDAASLCEQMMRDSQRIAAGATNVFEAMMANAVLAGSARCQVGVLMQGARLDPAVRSELAVRARALPDWIHRAVDGERIYGLTSQSRQTDGGDASVDATWTAFGQPRPPWWFRAAPLSSVRTLGSDLSSMAADTRLLERVDRLRRRGPASDDDLRIFLRDSYDEGRSVAYRAYLGAAGSLARLRIVLALDLLRSKGLPLELLPPELVVLEPDWPRDPFTGGPLRLDLAGDGTVAIWSAGEDWRDDGAADLRFQSAPVDVGQDLGIRVRLAPRHGGAAPGRWPARLSSGSIQ